MDDVEGDAVMVAQVIVLADVRAARAQVTVRVSGNPYAPLWSWWAFWMGGNAKAQAQKAGEVRAFVGQKCLNG